MRTIGGEGVIILYFAASVCSRGGGSPVKRLLLQRVQEEKPNLAGSVPLPLSFRLDNRTPTAVTGERRCRGWTTMGTVCPGR